VERGHTVNLKTSGVVFVLERKLEFPFSAKTTPEVFVPLLSEAGEVLREQRVFCRTGYRTTPMFGSDRVPRHQRRREFHLGVRPGELQRLEDQSVPLGSGRAGRGASKLR